ncbi:hypothetical protein GGF46_000621 [Coemansia sp. RSA 552]|nr:hypothetical protein GGF46_000621 [Coemansia sp. RSA 552]
MSKSTNLGFPRMGSDRQLKKLVEEFWASQATVPELCIHLDLVHGAADCIKPPVIYSNGARPHIMTVDVARFA